MPTDALISQELVSLVNGVSEQPAIQRSGSQGEAQVNCLSDVSRGVDRRAPMETVDRISELITAQQRLQPRAAYPAAAGHPAMAAPNSFAAMQPMPMGNQPTMIGAGA